MDWLIGLGWTEFWIDCFLDLLIGLIQRAMFLSTETTTQRTKNRLGEGARSEVLHTEPQISRLAAAPEAWRRCHAVTSTGRSASALSQRLGAFETAPRYATIKFLLHEDARVSETLGERGEPPATFKVELREGDEVSEALGQRGDANATTKIELPESAEVSQPLGDSCRKAHEPRKARSPQATCTGPGSASRCWPACVRSCEPRRVALGWSIPTYTGRPYPDVLRQPVAIRAPMDGFPSRARPTTSHTPPG